MTIREFERFLRDAGFSHGAASAITSHGFAAVRQPVIRAGFIERTARRIRRRFWRALRRQR